VHKCVVEACKNVSHTEHMLSLAHDWAERHIVFCLGGLLGSCNKARCRFT
jgi:hypothetical protein